MNSPNKAIGGYFELELNKHDFFHSNGILLNTGRNAFEHILKTIKPKRILLPFYICDVLLEPINKLKIKHEYYSIDENLEAIFSNTILKTDLFLYVNYFGLKDKYIQKLSKTIDNLVIDNSQALFSEPLKDINTFYSFRKFVGVTDGAAVYPNNKIVKLPLNDFSFNRINYLAKRFELDAENGYQDFTIVENSLSHQPIKQISKLTLGLLNNINFKFIKRTRNQNFLFLHKHLEYINEFKINKASINGPMVYPLLLKNGSKLRNILLKNRIFVATYWQSVNNIAPLKSFEVYLSNNLLPLPIDQRYSINEMKLIVKIIKKHNEH